MTALGTDLPHLPVGGAGIHLANIVVCRSREVIILHAQAGPPETVGTIV